MPPDLVIANARLAGRPELLDVAIADGRIVGIAPGIKSEAPRVDAGGKLLSPGLVECHIHLDKAEILDRTTIVEGTLAEAVRETARLKAAFTVEDVYARAKSVVERAILHGTMAMRSFVEVDPRAGLRSFEAICAIKRDYARAIDIEICAFAQEGLTNEPETETLLDAALSAGADLVGGCSYTDPEPAEHIARIFALAEKFGTAVDFHADFNLDPENADLPTIIAETERRGFHGRVACGHVTKLAAWTPVAVDAIAARLAATGIGIIALPATDLFLLGRTAETLTPRGLAPLPRLAASGVLTAVGTNNVLNPFTPYGDANLLRIANLAANLFHAARDTELDLAFDRVGRNAAKVLNRPFGIEIGSAADLVLFDASSPADAVRRIAPALMGWKAGKPTFERPAPRLFSA